MTTTAASSIQVDSAPDVPGVSFGHSGDGMVAALVHETAFAMAPGRDGTHYLVTAWSLRRPMREWTRSDFYGHSGDLADEAAFRARVLENAEHQQEKRALGRQDISSRANTPWGVSQAATLYADGIICHSTAGHGGFHLSAERNRKVSPLLRAADGWYEEDECWAIVAITFPQLFTGFERRCAERTIKDSWPDAWEAIFETILRPGESREKDRRAFEREHGSHWIVTAAISSTHERGFVEVVATWGGDRRPGVEERRFLVPAAEYRLGRFGFVVDEKRYRTYDGPSDFFGWAQRRRT